MGANDIASRCANEEDACGDFAFGVAAGVLAGPSGVVSMRCGCVCWV